MSGFITRIEREKEEPYTVIFTTDDHGKYLHIENECRIMIDHAKPQTNADRIRSMTDEELAEEIVKCRNADIFRRDVLGSWMYSTDEWLDWLKKEVDNG